MKREIAEAWIADLRTNPPQATGQLYDGEGYCCLGRLCLVVGATFEKGIDEDGDSYGLFPVLNGTMLSEHEVAGPNPKPCEYEFKRWRIRRE
jgi:hypothetical protein